MARLAEDDKNNVEVQLEMKQWARFEFSWLLRVGLSLLSVVLSHNVMIL